MYTDIKEFVISRSKWLRAKYKKAKPKSYLLDENGQMCCLGFYAKACGAKNIINVSTPFPLRHQWKTFLIESNLHDNTEVCLELMKVNDNPKTKDSQKELAIKQLFKKHDVKVKFVK